MFDFNVCIKGTNNRPHSSKKETSNHLNLKVDFQVVLGKTFPSTMRFFLCCSTFTSIDIKNINKLFKLFLKEQPSDLCIAGSLCCIFKWSANEEKKRKKKSLPLHRYVIKLLGTNTKAAPSFQRNYAVASPGSRDASRCCSRPASRVR